MLFHFRSVVAFLYDKHRPMWSRVAMSLVSSNLADFRQRTRFQSNSDSPFALSFRCVLFFVTIVLRRVSIFVVSKNERAMNPQYCTNNQYWFWQLAWEWKEMLWVKTRGYKRGYMYRTVPLMETQWRGAYDGEKIHLSNYECASFTLSIIHTIGKGIRSIRFDSVRVRICTGCKKSKCKNRYNVILHLRVVGDS